MKPEDIWGPDYEELSDLEKIGLENLNEVIEALQIPYESMYLMGSFMRRELNERSDVDIKLIVDRQYFPIIEQVRAWQQSKNIPVNIGYYDVRELESGTYLEKGSRHLPPHLFAANIESAILIDGKQQDTSSWYVAPLEERIQGQQEFVDALRKQNWGAKDDDRVYLLKKQEKILEDLLDQF